MSDVKKGTSCSIIIGRKEPIKEPDKLSWFCDNISITKNPPEIKTIDDNRNIK